MSKPLADMSRTEIIAMLSKPNQRLPPRVREFLAELLEDYEPEQIPDILATLAQAEVALRPYPIDADLMDLSFRELGSVLGYGTELPEIPGITDEIPGAFDMPLRELDKLMGPHECQYRLREYGETLDAEQAAALNAFAERYRFPD